MYTITVVKKVPNPNFEEEIKTYEQHSRYRNMNNDPEYPQKEISSNALMVQLTEDEYQVVKKAVIDTFK